MKFIFLGIFIHISLISLAQTIHGKMNVCMDCPAPRNDSYVVQYCMKGNSTGVLRQQGSCCKNITMLPNDDSFVGIDMSGCGLSNITGLFNNLQHLKVIMLEGNDQLKIQLSDFKGLAILEYLSLPSGLECPGGNGSWKAVDHSNNTVICHQELNLCAQNNLTCANNNSHCTMVGPGDMECLCRPGYHGYKCLRKGEFRTTNYAVILSVCTVLISGFLWCTQRRKVTKTTSHLR